MSLQLEPNIPDPDGFYQELIGMQRDLDEEQATLFQARLLLVLANHVGDRAVLTQAMQVALRAGTSKAARHDRHSRSGMTVTPAEA